MSIEFDEKDVQHVLARTFHHPIHLNCGAGKSAFLFHAHEDEAALLAVIVDALSKPHLSPGQEQASVQFEVDLSELAPLKESAGVSLGCLSETPLKISKSLSTGSWSCQFPTDERGGSCTIRGTGLVLNEYESGNEVTPASNFDQSDRDFLFYRLFQLNKALDGYCRLMGIERERTPAIEAALACPPQFSGEAAVVYPRRLKMESLEAWIKNQ
jgi:hypothetical protein